MGQARRLGAGVHELVSGLPVAPGLALSPSNYGPESQGTQPLTPFS
jgi:hypothetical protein